MPKLPQYSSKGQMTTQAMPVKTGAGQVAEAVGQVADVGMQITAELQRAKNEMKNAELLAQYNERSAQETKDAQFDEDLENGEKNRIKTLSGEVETLLDNVKNPYYKERLALELNHKQKMDEINFAKIYTTKKVARMKGLVIPQLMNKIAEQKAMYPRDSAQWQSAEMEKQRYLKAWKDSNIISDVEVEAIESAERTQVVLYEATKNPTKVLADVENLKKYTNLTMDERVAVASKIRGEIIRVQRLQKESEDINQYLLSSKLLDGNLKEEEIELMVQAHKVDPMTGITEQTGLLLKKNLYSNLERRLKDAKGSGQYVKAIDFIFTGSDSDRARAYDAVLEAFSGDRENPDHAKFLLELINLKTAKTESLAKPNPIIDFGKKVIELLPNVSFMSKKDEYKLKKDVMYDYIERVRLSNNPELSSKQALYQMQKDEHPALILTNDDVDKIYYYGQGTYDVPIKKPKEDKK